MTEMDKTTSVRRVESAVRARIVGAAEYPARRFSEGPTATSLEQAADLALQALNDAGLSLRDVDGISVRGIYVSQQFLPATVAEYLGVGRGDQFKFVVSMSSPEMSLTHYRNETQPNGGRHAGEKYVCGDMNTSLIQTELGRTILVQHDVVSPRPYSRINALYGTGAVFFDYPARLSVDHPKQFGLDAGGSEDWLSDKDLQTMRDKFTHPLWKKLAERAKGGGHGGMDFVMSWRLLDCLRRGVTPDSVVYDAAAWSSIIETSVHSVANGSAPVTIPDFTRGLWKTMQPLGIAEG